MTNRPLVWLRLLVFAGVLFPTTALAQSQPSDQEAQDLRKQLNDLREQMNEQMNKLQARIDELENRNTPTAAPALLASATAKQKGTTGSTRQLPPNSSPQQPGQATATYTQFQEDAAAAPRFDNVPLDPKYPGFFQLPGTDTMLKIGGFFKTDFIRDLKPAGNIYAFAPSSFPVPQVAGVYNSNVSVGPTRLSLDLVIPKTKLGEWRSYLELDFFGNNSTTPRLRHAYAQVRNLLVGQTFTNFMDPDSIPDTLDFQGPNGYVYLRNPQLRYGLALRPGTTFYVSVEKASSSVIFTTPQGAAEPNSPAPDGTVRLRQEFERGHLQVAAIFRDIAAFLPSGETGSVFGWGVNTSGSINTFGRDNLIIQVAAGHGISRYIGDTSGLGIDAEPASIQNPHLVATPAVGLAAAYQHYWSKALRSNAVYSYAAVNNTDLVLPNTYNHATYTATNLIWNPGGSLNLGAEVLYGWVMEQNGKKANDTRIQFSAKYSFVKIGAKQ